jgi:RNA polymerase sigma-70 factor, ECF subfamily
MAKCSVISWLWMAGSSLVLRGHDGPAANRVSELISKTVDGGDLDLMLRARNGDRAAYGQIIRLYQDRLFNALLRLVGDANEAAELTQAAFSRGLGQIGTFNEDTSPYVWLYRIGLNLSVTALRRSRRPRTFALESDGEGRPIAQALGRIEPDYRAVLLMRDIEQFDYPRMGEVLGLPMASVKSRLFRARLALRDELKR